ncbi:endogenous retrovirus group K member 113 Pro protein-like [Callospermophilus lateralis]|uniref:endogenous retrovirus group K member 113 Pro protein-like n=1 Tax=Callospermophilus lateralis TaxID=76772 RepID=UPI0040543064
MYLIMINGQKFFGLLDTGADRSIIRHVDWPKSWPLQKASQTLRGLGTTENPDCSAATLSWSDEEGHSGVIQPYVLPIPVNLWGRDILTQMDVTLTTQRYYSPKARQIMSPQGYTSGGLGNKGQG